MNIVKNKKVYFAAATLAAVLGLAACEEKKAPADIVGQRALERWGLLAERKAIKAYDYLSPGYRTTHSVDQYAAYIATAPLQWKSATLIPGQTQCDAQVCTVALMVKSVVPGPLAHLPHDLETNLRVVEHWIASDGQWYLLPENMGPNTVRASGRGTSAPQAGNSPPLPAAPVPAEAPASAGKPLDH